MHSAETNKFFRALRSSTKGSALEFRKFSEENLTKDFIRSLVGRTFLPQRLNKYHGVQEDAEHGRYHADGKPGDGKAFAPLKALLNL